MYQAVLQDQNQRGKNDFPQCENLLGEILPWKLITLRESDQNGWCLREPFTFDRQQDFERERENQPIGACLLF